MEATNKTSGYVRRNAQDCAVAARAGPSAHSIQLLLQERSLLLRLAISRPRRPCVSLFLLPTAPRHPAYPSGRRKRKAPFPAFPPVMTSGRHGVLLDRSAPPGVARNPPNATALLGH
jgi:hypothetical protein